MSYYRRKITKEDIIKMYKISKRNSECLEKLNKFKVVLILDDSESMNDYLSERKTKWKELKITCAKIIEILEVYKIDCDAYFLNRPAIKGINDSSDLMFSFLTPSSGLKPLTEIIKKALDNNCNRLKSGKLLLLVFTDGIPTSNTVQHHNEATELKQLLLSRKPIDKIFVSIIACTNDKEAMSFLNNWDNEIENFDAVDDFESERNKISNQNDSLEFTKGDYLAKILLGSLVKEFDKADESPTTRDQRV